MAITVKQLMKKAAAQNDWQLVGKITEELRAKGLNYDDICRLFGDITGMEPADYEVHMQEYEYMYTPVYMLKI